MTKSAVQREKLADDVDGTVTDDALVARIEARRRAGLDTTQDVEELLRRAGKDNRAALDRLAK